MVVRRAERARADEAAGIFEDACDAVNARGFNGFFQRHGRKDGENALGEHGFACARRPDEKNVVAAGAGDFESALGGLLAVNVAQIDGVLRGFGEQLLGIDVNGLKGLRGIHKVDGLRQRFERENVDTFDDGGLAGVSFRDGERFDADFARGERSGKSAAHGANAAVEGKLAEKHALV